MLREKNMSNLRREFNTQWGSKNSLKTPRLKNRFVMFSAILFLIIFVAGSVSFIFSMRQIVRVNKGKELARILEIERIKLEISVNAEIAIVLKLADSPLIKRYFSNPGDTELEKVAKEEISSYRRAFTGYSIFWVNDRDKSFYSDDNAPYVVDPADPKNYWYNMTLHETEKYNFNINYNPNLKVTKLWINAPVFDEEHKSLGMVGTGIELSAFVDAIYQNVDDKIDIYFFNTHGEITGARNLDLVAKKRGIKSVLTEIDVFDHATKLEPGKTQTFNVPNGKIAISTVPALEWYSVAFIPDSVEDYKTHLTALFLLMITAIALIFVIFNVFIARFLKSLKSTMESLETASKAKGDFLAKMSHEIRTPMNAIVGMAELALRGNIPPAEREHIVTIKQSSISLLSIINDILDFSKIESGKLEIVLGDYLLSSLINDVISIIRMRAIDTKVEFIVDIDSNVPNALHGDETRIRQILLNILSNAIKYTEKGHVSITIIGIHIDDNTINLVIVVTDSGKGIKQEDTERLFGDYAQFDLVNNRGIEGTGLGLSITYNFIKAMGGDIFVRSEYGKGSTFTVTLPQKVSNWEKLAVVENTWEKRVLIYEHHEMYANSIVRSIENLGVDCTLVSTDSEFSKELSTGSYTFVFIAFSLYEKAKKICREFAADAKIVLLSMLGETVVDNNLSVLAMPVHAISIANILNGITDQFSYNERKESDTRFTAPDASVLVVDDINTNLNVAEGLLRPYKMRVTLCKSGKEAINAITAQKYDLVFMDHMMPGMDGIETVKYIRAFSTDDPYFKTVPIVVFTANAVSGIKEMFMESGFDDYLSKPIDTIELNTILEKWIPEEKQKKIPSVFESSIAIQNSKQNAGLTLEIEGVDVEKGIRICGGTVENYKRVLAVFQQDGIEKGEKLKKCLEENDVSLYVTYVHALKSAAANVGADELSERAKALELAGNQGDWTFIQTHNAQFFSVLETILDNIDNVLKQNEQNKRNDSVDMNLLKTELAKLAEAIESVNPRAINAAVKCVYPFAQAADVGDSVEKILQSTLIGEYDEAVLMINALLQENFQTSGE
jgi:signal transduction histidine kinase/CheY-like chemotaxis protein/HPt (histidine-containing phosphotransfer) domain-containing protein